MNPQLLLKPARKVVKQTETAWWSSRTPARLASLADFPEPIGRRLASVFHCMKTCDLSDESKEWIEKIEAKRREMLTNTEPLVKESTDKTPPEERGVIVSNVCEREPKGQQAATLLHLLIREFQPATALEMGTSLGISSAYQAAAIKMNGRGHLVTLERSPARVRLAENLHKSLDLENITYVLGYFTNTLDNALSQLKTVDYAFIDGHHQLQPTLDYFDKVWHHMAENAIVVFDDIRWSDDMKRAWQILKQDPRIKISIDLNQVGICVTTHNPSNTPYEVPVIYLGNLGGDAQR